MFLSFIEYIVIDKPHRTNIYNKVYMVTRFVRTVQRYSFFQTMAINKSNLCIIKELFVFLYLRMNNIQLTPFRKGVVGVQFLFVAFGATVLVPLLVGLDPATALFTAGIGTFIFHLVTKGKVPIFLGSSFAFIAPIIEASKMWGMPGTLAGIAGVALVYFLMSALVKWQGRKLLNRLFPPVVIGPVIILIGLSLSGSAVNMAKENWLLAFVALVTAITVLMLGKGLLKLVPIVCGIIVGFIVAALLGEVDFSKVQSAAWFSLPGSLSNFHWPEFAWKPFIYMIPVAIAPVIEHIGDVYVVGAVAGKDFVEEPGLHRTMLGDGLACLAACFFGGPPVTTYSEVTGAMQITKVTHPQVIRISALTAIVFSVIGKLSALLQSIPQAVLGGIMLLLFGTIASVGVQNLIQHKVDMNYQRNVIIVSVTLTLGIGGAILDFTLRGILIGVLMVICLMYANSLKSNRWRALCCIIGGILASLVVFFYLPGGEGELTKMSGIGLSAIVGVVLNLVLPKDKEEEMREG